jgi:autonomous glycyl radical cofactor GrcA
MKRQIALSTILFGLAVFSRSEGVNAQSYSRGQNISPAFEGWERNPDGSFNFLFGYMNRNWEEELDVPIGPDNNLSPGAPNQGQPTHFLPRRNRFVFRVRVPADFGEQREMIWTLTTAGKTEKAYATLRTDYFIDDVVMASETGALGAGTSSPEVRSNKRPDVRVEGEKTRNVKAGEPLTIVAVVSDDGIPKPRDRAPSASIAAARAARGASSTAPIPLATSPEAAATAARARSPFTPPSRNTVGKVTGLHVGWFVYHGAGKVTFDPPQIKVWEDTRAGANSPWAPLWQPPPVPEGGRYVTQVTFDRPGTYVLRARADDGALVDDDDVTVNVTR